MLLYVLFEKDSKRLALSIVVHIDAKKVLKMFPFSRKPGTNLSSTNTGGIVRIFPYASHLI